MPVWCRWRRGAEVIAVVRHAAAAERLRELGAQHVVVAEAVDSAAAAATAAAATASGGVDVFVDTTRHVDVGAVPDRINPRGRIVLIAGQGTVEVDLWRFYVREIGLLGFVMSEMSVPELAAAAAWINARQIDARRQGDPLAVSVGQVLSFADAARAHALLESDGLPRLADGTVGRLVLRP